MYPIEFNLIIIGFPLRRSDSSENVGILRQNLEMQTVTMLMQHLQQNLVAEMLTLKSSKVKFVASNIIMFFNQPCRLALVTIYLKVS
jgi:hypothetical protein